MTLTLSVTELSGALGAVPASYGVEPRILTDSSPPSLGSGTRPRPPGGEGPLEPGGGAPPLTPPHLGPLGLWGSQEDRGREGETRGGVCCGVVWAEVEFVILWILSLEPGSLTHSFTHSSTHANTHPPTHSHTHSLTHLLTHTLTQSHINSLTHSFTIIHSLMHPR